MFEIPLLVDMICQDLDKADFQNCSKVNRVFFLAFQPYLWRTLRLLGDWYLEYETTGLHGRGTAVRATRTISDEAIEAHQKLFLEKSQWIRSLEFDQDGLPNELNVGVLFAFRPESLCNNLLELSTLFIDQERDFAEEEEEEDEVNALFVEKTVEQTVVEQNVYAAEALGVLMDRNARLRKVEVNLGSVGRLVLPILMEPLKKHPYLQELRISTWTHFPGPVLERLLKHLPATLQVFWMGWEQVVPGLGSEEEGYMVLESGSDPDDAGELGSGNGSWPRSYPALQEVHLAGLYSGLKGPHIPRFLQRCPRLHTLTWPGRPTWRSIDNSISDPLRFLGTLFQNHHSRSGEPIRHLTFEMGRYDDQELEGLARAIDGIETLKLKIAYPSHGGFFWTISHRWFDTLRVLELGGKVVVRNVDIGVVLVSCPNLTVFKVENSSSLTSCLNVERVSRSGSPPWACLGLEVLQVCFADLHSSHENFDDPNLDLDEDDIAFQKSCKALSPITAATITELHNRPWIRGVYRQLGTLTRLQTLILGSVGPLNDCMSLGQYHNRTMTSFDLSLESGLYHLKGLTDLRVFNIDRFKILNIGPEELLWMRQHWPKLQHIEGLDDIIGV
ncbi:hypothetical protein BGX33_009036 [Mortierella sp. NVP41]|nr:hypothetical protein BGX33_009036 [Mortierella sp. NVP41]